MLVTNRRSFYLGLVMAATFILAFLLLFLPLFGGGNAFQAADKLFNSIAKGSTYHIPELIENAEAERGTLVKLSLNLGGEKATAEALLAAHRTPVQANGNILDVQADLGSIVHAALDDADAMFYNRGEEVSAKYGVPERQVLLSWWRLMREVERGLKSEGRFKEAAFVAEAAAKGVEVGYNFYGIQPEKASTKAGILSLALISYVVYTLWWGYAIYFLAEGLGLQIKAGKKKEV